MSSLHLKQRIRLKDLGRTGALLVIGILHERHTEEVEKDRSGALDVPHALLEQGKEESGYGQSGMVAAMLVGLNFVDDAPVQRFGLTELSGFDEGSGKVVPLGQHDLTRKLVGAGAGEGRGELASVAPLLFPADGGVVFERSVDPVLATLVEDTA